MKIERDYSEATILGEIEENTVSIATEDTDFIVGLLTTKLYSDPITSFIREIASNAEDSHTEAGIDKPIIVELGEELDGTYYCRIQDFGTGISPEKATTIYAKLGKSTRNESNNFIGGFGIGKFSSLAYSKGAPVHITSIHEGTKYSYVMYQDGPKIKLDLLYSSPTEEHNGVEIKVSIKEIEIEEFAKKITSNLPFFNNVYFSTNFSDSAYKITIHNSIRQKELFEDIQIKKFKNFSIMGTGSKNHSLPRNVYLRAVLGKVIYKIDTDNIPYSLYHKAINHSNRALILNFEVGELDVSPNREALVYSDKTIKAIEEKMKLTYYEIREVFFKAVKKDYKDIPEYIRVCDSLYFDLMKEDLCPHFYSSDAVISLAQFDLANNKDWGTTLNGEEIEIPIFSALFDRALSFNLSRILQPKAVVSGGRISSSPTSNLLRGLRLYNIIANTKHSPSADSKLLFIHEKDYDKEMEDYLRYLSRTDYTLRDAHSIKHYYIFTKKPPLSKIAFLRLVAKELKDRGWTFWREWFRVTRVENADTKRIETLKKERNYVRIILKFIIEKVKNIEVVTKDSFPEKYIEKVLNETAKKAIEKKSKKGISAKNVARYFVTNGCKGHEVKFGGHSSYKAAIHISPYSEKAKYLAVYGKYRDPNLVKLAQLVSAYSCPIKNVSRNFERRIRIMEIPIKFHKEVAKLQNFVHIDDYLDMTKKNKNQLIRRIATAQYICKEYPHLEELTAYKPEDSYIHKITAGTRFNEEGIKAKRGTIVSETLLNIALAEQRGRGYVLKLSPKEVKHFTNFCTLLRIPAFKSLSPENLISLNRNDEGHYYIWDVFGKFIVIDNKFSLYEILSESNSPLIEYYHDGVYLFLSWYLTYGKFIHKEENVSLLAGPFNANSLYILKTLYKHLSGKEVSDILLQELVNITEQRKPIYLDLKRKVFRIDTLGISEEEYAESYEKALRKEDPSVEVFTIPSFYFGTYFYNEDRNYYSEGEGSKIYLRNKFLSELNSRWASNKVRTIKFLELRINEERGKVSKKELPDVAKDPGKSERHSSDYDAVEFEPSVFRVRKLILLSGEQPIKDLSTSVENLRQHAGRNEKFFFYPKEMSFRTGAVHKSVKVISYTDYVALKEAENNTF